jgi:SAM-dependent methyltransferase
MGELGVQTSFRDPDGFTVLSGGRVFRCVLPDIVDEVRAFLASSLAQSLIAEGALAETHRVDDLYGIDLPACVTQQFPPGALILEHTPIPFSNYPYEWAPGMLRAAAALTLRLARAAITSGFTLKDATPYNVMFDGPCPVFLDLLSFRRGDGRATVWPPYAQFIRTFVYTLLAWDHFRIRTDELLIVNREGLEPQRMLALCPWSRRFLPPFLSCVTLPSWFEGREAALFERGLPSRPARNVEQATFILDRLFRGAERLLRAPKKRRPHSSVVSYMENLESYDPGEFARKDDFVRKAFAESAPENVLDIGCNTGHFSFLAARTGARVIAIDRDPEATDAVWQKARETKAAVLPLVIDIARPPAGYGWANRECLPFLDRARGRFDYVLLLGILHHLLVSERIPLAPIVELAAELTTRFAVIEYVDPSDPQFRRIARGRDVLHRELTRESFEAAVRRHFCIAEHCHVGPTRTIYLLQKAGC